MGSPVGSFCIQDPVHLWNLLEDVCLGASIELTCWQGFFSSLFLNSILDIGVLLSIYVLLVFSLLLLMMYVDACTQLSIVPQLSV